MAEKWIDRSLTSKVRDVLLNADKYHRDYYAASTFSGPSLHFHRRALGLGTGTTDVDKLELIYAVLTSWGMHRMGANGSKMQDYQTFAQSVAMVRSDLESLRGIHPERLSHSTWSAMERVFKKIKVMATGTTIVGNSKVMAHLLPDLVAPVDREYTLRFLFGSPMFQNNLEQEWRVLRKIHSEFYYLIASDKGFRETVRAWQADKHRYPWDTSILKIIDNLVIGAMKTQL